MFDGSYFQCIYTSTSSTSSTHSTTSTKLHLDISYCAKKKHALVFEIRTKKGDKEARGIKGEIN